MAVTLIDLRGRYAAVSCFAMPLIDPLVPQPSFAGGQLTYLAIAIPTAFTDAVKRHHAHLQELAASLRDCGVPAGTLQAQIDALVSSYRDALLISISDLKASAT